MTHELLINQENLKEPLQRNKIQEVEVSPGHKVRCLYTSAEYLHTFYYMSCNSFLDEIHFDPLVSFHIIKDEDKGLDYFCFNAENLCAVVEVRNDEDKKFMDTLYSKLSTTRLVPIEEEDQKKLGEVFNRNEDQFKIQENLSEVREAVTTKSDEIFQDQKFEVIETTAEADADGETPADETEQPKSPAKNGGVTLSSFMFMVKDVVVANDVYKEKVGIPDEEEGNEAAAVPSTLEEVQEEAPVATLEETAEKPADEENADVVEEGSKTRDIGEIPGSLLKSLFDSEIPSKSLSDPDFDIHAELPPNQIFDLEVTPGYIVKCLNATADGTVSDEFIAGLADDKISAIHFKTDQHGEKKLAISANKHALLIPAESKVPINEAIAKIAGSEVVCFTEEDTSELFSYWKFDLIRNFATEEKLTEVRAAVPQCIAEHFETHGVVEDDIMTYSTFLFLTQEVLAVHHSFEAPTEEFEVHPREFVEIEALPAPAEEAPAEEAPAEEVPAEEVPAEEVPAEEVPAEEVPAEEVPAEEAPAEEEVHTREFVAEEVPAGDNNGDEEHQMEGIFQSLRGFGKWVDETQGEEAAVGTRSLEPDFGGLHVISDFPSNHVNVIDFLPNVQLNAIYTNSGEVLDEAIIDSIEVMPCVAFHFSKGETYGKYVTFATPSHTVILTEPTTEVVNSVLFRMQNSYLVPVDGEDRDMLSKLYTFDGRHFPTSEEHPEMIEKIKEEHAQTFPEPFHYDVDMCPSRFLGISSKTVIAHQLYQDRQPISTLEEGEGVAVHARSLLGAEPGQEEAAAQPASLQNIFGSAAGLLGAPAETQNAVSGIAVGLLGESPVEKEEETHERETPALLPNILAPEAIAENVGAEGKLEGNVTDLATSLLEAPPAATSEVEEEEIHEETAHRAIDDIIGGTLSLFKDTPYSFDLHAEFTPNECHTIEVLPGYNVKCLYSTEDDETLHNFTTELGCDQYATIHFKNGQKGEKTLSICTVHHCLLINAEKKDSINQVIYQIQQSEIYSITEEDKSDLFTYWKFDLLRNFATEEKLAELRSELPDLLNERFSVNGVVEEENMTYSTFLFLTQEVLSTYNCLTHQNEHEDHQHDNEANEEVPEAQEETHERELPALFAVGPALLNAADNAEEIEIIFDHLREFARWVDEQAAEEHHEGGPADDDNDEPASSELPESENEEGAAPEEEPVVAQRSLDVEKPIPFGEEITRSEKEAISIFSDGFNIHSELETNVVREIEVYPGHKFNCVFINATDEAVCNYIASIKTGKFSSIHYAYSPNHHNIYFSFLTGDDLVVIVNPSIIQYNGITRKLGGTSVIPTCHGDIDHLFFYDFLNKVNKTTPKSEVPEIVEEISNVSQVVYKKFQFTHDNEVTYSRFMNICTSTILGLHIRSQYHIKPKIPTEFETYSLHEFIYLRTLSPNVDLYMRSSTGRLYAIKKYQSSQLHNQSIYVYKHKHYSCIVPCFGSIQEGGNKYLVFGFTSHGSLSNTVKDMYLDLASIRKIVIELVFGLAYLHLTNCAPCNVKFNNIFVYWDLDVQLGCFDQYERAIGLSPTTYDCHNLGNIIYNLVIGCEPPKKNPTISSFYGLIAKVFDKCREDNINACDLVALIISCKLTPSEAVLVDRLIEELPSKSKNIEIMDDLTMRYCKINCYDCNALNLLKALRVGDHVAFHFKDHKFIFSSNKVFGVLTNITAPAINVVLKKMQNTLVIPIDEEDIHTLFKYSFFDLLRNFCRGKDLESIRARIPKIRETMKPFHCKAVTGDVLAAVYAASHPVRPPTPPPEPIALCNPRFNVHRQLETDVPRYVEVFPDFTLKCLYSTGDNNALHNFIDEIGCDQFATIQFQEDNQHVKHFCICTVHHCLLINAAEKVAINKILYQIQQSEIFSITDEDRSELFGYWKFDLLRNFAEEDLLESFRNEVESVSNASFPAGIELDEELTYSTYFAIARDAVAGYFILAHPDKSSFNPKARSLDQSLDGTSFQTFVGVNGMTDAKKAFELYQAAAAKDDPAALFNLGLMYSRGEGIAKDKTKAAEYYTKAAARGNPKAQFNLGLMYAKGDGVPVDKTKALELYTQAAEQGSAKAQSNLGLMYSKGDGVPVDYEKAVNLYTQAAEQDDADALLNLGLMYDQGEGVEKDKKKAVELYTRASDKGNAKAQFNLGVIYHKGEEGIEKDNKKAVEYYSMAAAKKIAQAQFNLGVMYSKGAKDVPVDKKKAVQLFTMASDQNDPDAQLNLGAMYAKGDGVKKNKEKTIELYTKAAEQGNPKAQFNLGVMYSKGDGTKQDKAKAAEYYEQAAKKIQQAQFNLGVMYFKGDGIPKDKTKAAELFEGSAKHHNPKALFNLAVMYQKGDGVDVDKLRAIELYEEAGNLNNQDALLNLGVMYGEGDGIEKDKAKALEYYTRAAELGNAKAQLNLGLMYYNGDGCQKDFEKAREYYQKAADQGNAQAQLNLGLMYIDGDREKSLDFLEKSADQGNVDALLSLAQMHYNNDEKARAVELYSQAAALGSTQAQTALGGMYLHADGVDQDLDKAEALLQEAADSGDNDALLLLGDLYDLRGDGQKAQEFYEKAASKGVFAAEDKLVQAKTRSLGPDDAHDQNEEEAIDEQKDGLNKLFETLISRIGLLHQQFEPPEVEFTNFKATLEDVADFVMLPEEHGVKKGLSDCVGTYQSSNCVIKAVENEVNVFMRDMTERIDKQVQQGSKLPSLKRNGSNGALLSASRSNSSLGSQLSDDDELSRLRIDVDSLESQIAATSQRIADSRKAAIKQSDRDSPRRGSNTSATPREPNSPNTIGRCPPSPRSSRTKIKSLLRKADEGDDGAQYALGACYALGEGVAADKEKAFEYYSQAAELGNVNAQFAVASCFSYGKGTEVDKEKAFEFYKQAAEKGHAKAQFALGHFYQYGQGVEQNQEEATAWYSKAADQGHRGAKKALDEYTSTASELIDYDSPNEE